MGLDHVHDPVEALLHEEVEAVASHQPVPVPRLVGEGELHTVTDSGDSDGCRGVEPPSRLVRPLEDVRSPGRELDHAPMLAELLCHIRGIRPPAPGVAGVVATRRCREPQEGHEADAQDVPEPVHRAHLPSTAPASSRKPADTIRTAEASRRVVPGLGPTRGAPGRPEASLASLRSCSTLSSAISGARIGNIAHLLVVRS